MLSSVLAVLDLPELAAGGGLQLGVVRDRRILIVEADAALVLVALDGRGEAYHIAHDARLHLWLNKSSPKAVLSQILRQLEAASVAESVQAGGRVADPAHGDLLGRDRDHLFRDHVGRHNVKRVEQVAVVFEVRLADVVLQDLFLLRIVLEVLF